MERWSARALVDVSAAMLLVAVVGAVPAAAQDDAGSSGRGGGAESILQEARQSVADPIDALISRLSRDAMAALRAIWKELGISSELFAGAADDARVQVAVFSVNLLKSGSSETLLRITDDKESDYQFLALDRSGDSLSLVGAIEVWNQKETPPQHRVEALDDDHRWLVLRALKGSGNGFERYHETWYEAGGRLESVLTYPVEGHVSGHGLPFDRTFTGTVASLSMVDDAPAVTVDLNVQYSNGDVFEIENLDHLFSRSESVRYCYKDGSFSLDADASSMTEAEIAGIYADDEAGFLRHNFTQLKALVGDDEPRREWLRRFLARQEESTEKTVLTELLDAGAAAADGE